MQQFPNFSCSGLWSVGRSDPTKSQGGEILGGEILWGGNPMRGKSYGGVGITDFKHPDCRSHGASGDGLIGWGVLGAPRPVRAAQLSEGSLPMCTRRCAATGAPYWVLVGRGAMLANLESPHQRFEPPTGGAVISVFDGVELQHI